MRGVGLGGEDICPALVVEPLHQSGIAAEPLRGGNLLDRVVFPQTVLGAEGAQARFGADPGAGEDHNVANYGHVPHEARGIQEWQWPASVLSAVKGAWDRR